MSQDSRRWLIKNKTGQIRGPFATRDIVGRIRRGELGEDDKIALYPGSKWIPISHNPEFYDVLLELLSSSSPNEFGEDPSQFENVDEEPPKEQEAGPEDKQTEGPFFTQSNSKTVNDEYLENETPKQTSTDTKKRVRASSKTTKVKSRGPESDDGDEMVIELSPMEEVVKKEKIRSIKLPLIIIAVVVILFIIILSIPAGNKSGKVHLLQPSSKRELSPEKVERKYKVGQRYYLLDTFSNYLKAQNEFVQVIESRPKHLKSMAMLCLTYLQLWPYSHKDAEDNRAVLNLLQRAKKIDPTGINGNTCNVVHKLIKGEYEQANSITDGVLNAFEDAEDPPVVFYYFKSLNLSRSSNYQSALGYITSAQRLWPQWLRAYMEEALIHEKLKNFTSAATRYNQVLGVNADHKEALLRLGLLEFRAFFRYENAKKLLKRGLGVKERESPRLISDAYVGLAEMAIRENDQSSACKYAKNAYQEYSANMVAKNILVNNCNTTNLPESNDEPLIQEGKIYEREGNYTAAQALYKSAFEKNPKNGQAALFAAQALWKLSFSTEAILWLNKAIKSDPTLIEAYITLADYYSQRYNFGEAGIILQKANRIAPQNFEVLRGYAIVEFRRRSYQGAIGFGEQVLKIYDSDVETYILLANSSLELGKYSDAYGYANKAIELNPNSREAHIVFAKTLAGVEGINSGLDYMSRLVEQFPLITDYRMALGKMYMRDERYAAAKEVFLQVLQLDENPKEARIQLGRIFRIAGDFESSREMFIKASVLDPADPDPLFELGMLYLQVKKPKEAKQQFERVKELNPMYPLVNYHIGQSALLEGKAQVALEMAQEEQRLNPKLTEPYILAAEAYAKKGKGHFSLCAREYQKAIQLQPQGAIIYVRLATCYRKSGNLDLAERMLNQAAKRESGLPEIYREQAQVFEVKGEINKAIEAYNQYLSLNPSAPDAGQVRKKMESLGQQ